MLGKVLKFSDGTFRANENVSSYERTVINHCVGRVGLEEYLLYGNDVEPK